MPPNTRQTILIEPRKGRIAFDFKELWDRRDLLYFMAWRDLKVRYRQTLLGFAWAVINPVVNTVVFTLIFGGLAGLPTDGLPHALFYMIGLLFWRYFSATLSGISMSLVGNVSMLTKVYFPRLLIPLNACLTGLAEFGIALILVLGLMLYFNILPAATAVFLPLLLFAAMLCAFGVGLLFASMNVRYRDVGQIVPFTIQIWMYASVIVPFSRLPERWGDWRYLYGLNPMAGIIETARWCLAHPVMEVQPPLRLLAMGVPFIVVSVLAGLVYFKKVENQFADIF